MQSNKRWTEAWHAALRLINTTRGNDGVSRLNRQHIRRVTNTTVAELLELLRAMKADGVIDFCRERMNSELGIALWIPNERIFPEPKERIKRKPVSDSLWIMVQRKTGGLCAYCAGHEANTLDHIVPHSKGGATDLPNLVAACRKCNEEKKDLSLESFRSLQNRFTLRKDYFLESLPW